MDTLNRWFREPVSGLTHLAGAVAAVPGTAWLIRLGAGDPVKMASFAIYGFSLVLLFLSSAVMHLTHGSRRLIDWLNRVDHAAIYVLTAGTYTPVMVNVVEGPLKTVLLVVVWLMAAGGVLHKLIIGPGRKSSRLSTGFYLLMGWLAVLVLPQLVRKMPLEAIALIAAGGLAYSTGVIFYLKDDPDIRPAFGLHEIWHLFVLLGSGLHFAAVALFVA